MSSADDGFARNCMALEQEPGQVGIVGDPGGAIEHALELRLRLMILREETGLGIRAGIEQRPSRLEEPAAPVAVQPQVFRKTEMGQGVPPARPTSADRKSTRL